MVRAIVCLFSASVFAFAAAPGRPPAVNLILDTDMGNDIDDALALAMIHALQSRGEVKLLAVTITKDNRYAAPYVDLVNTYYGRPGIPVGVVHNGKTPEDAAYIQQPSEQRDRNNRYTFPHRLTDGSKAPEAVALLTRILQQQPDASVTIAQIGFSTNLARLIKSPEGRELVRRKVKLLSVMGGNFVGGGREYNIYTDPPAASTLLSEWPTPMVFSGFEIGLAVTFPYAAFTTGFAYAPQHPIAAAAMQFFAKPEDRAAWDPTAVLYAIRPDAGYFKLSEPGSISLDTKDLTLFQPDPTGLCRYLILDPQKIPAIRHLLVDFVTEPPAASSRR